MQVIQRTSLALDHSISIISALHLLLLQPVSSSAATGQASSSPSSTPGLIPPTTTTTPPSSHSLPSLTAAHPESDIQFFLTNLRNLLHTQQSRLSALEPRLESTTSVIHSFQSLHNLLELKSLNEKALTTQKESEARASASEARAQAAASDAARTERLTLIVAVISILYLPANFSAQLFGMQYVHVWEDGIVFDMGIRAWGVLTVVLTAMTAVAFAVYEWRGMSKGRRKERMAVVGKWARCGCC